MERFFLLKSKKTKREIQQKMVRRKKEDFYLADFTFLAVNSSKDEWFDHMLVGETQKHPLHLGILPQLSLTHPTGKGESQEEWAQQNEPSFNPSCFGRSFSKYMTY